MVKILIAEPSKTLAALIKLSLAELGAELEVAYDGAAALAAARLRLPDALICDQALPGLDGYGLAHHVKQLAHEEGRPAVPVLLLVSEHATPDSERLSYVGIGDVLAKPFERAVLIERVRALFDAPVAAGRGVREALALPPVSPMTAPPPTSPFLRPNVLAKPGVDAAGPELEALVAKEAQRAVEGTLESVLALKLPSLLELAVQRYLPALVQTTLERAVAERVPAMVEAAVSRALAELATPTTIAKIVSDDARVLIGESATRLEARLEGELLERLDKFVRETLPGRLQTHAEQVIWKIVPTLAEGIVKDEIKRLTQENP